LTDKSSKAQHSIFLENGKALIFDNGKKGIALNGFEPVIIDIENEVNEVLWIHDEMDPMKAYILSRFFDNPEMPSPFGVLYCNDTKPCLDDLINQQIADKKIDDKVSAFNNLLKSNNSWEVK